MENYLQKYPLGLLAYPVKSLGVDEFGKPIELLIGIITMKEYSIIVDIKNQKLDLTHSPKEFVEYRNSIYHRFNEFEKS